jgi:hypothetical protein
MSFDVKLEHGMLVLDTNGDLSRVDKAEKLLQDILKMLITPLGTNYFAPWYGSAAGNVIGNILDNNFAASLTSSQIRASLETLSKMQAIQAKNQYLSPEEQIAAIRESTFRQNTVDPRYISIVASVVNKAFQQVNTTLDVAI